MKTILCFLIPIFINTFAIASPPLTQETVANSPKIELSFSHALIDSKKTCDDTIFRYRVNLTSNQKMADTKLKMVAINAAGQRRGTADVWFDNEHRAWISEGRGDLLLEEFEITINNMSDGEFLDLVIEDGKKQKLAATRIFPKPIECKAADGASLRLRLSAPEIQNFELKGHGFKPNENLILISQSEKEIVPASAYEVSKEGNFTGFISPQVVGKAYGRASVTIIRQDGSKMKLSYLWGIPEEKLARNMHKI